MSGKYILEIAAQELHLLPQRAIWWPARKALIVSDLHIGKAAHFRKAGISLPQTALHDDLAVLEKLITDLDAAEVIATGDLFHSKHNREVDTFGIWRNRFPEVAFHLVQGNHDILKAQAYTDLQLQVTRCLQVENLAFCHDKPLIFAPDYYYLTGHLHPGVQLRGAGRQVLRLPCFYFSDQYAVLPAFSRLTGLAMLTPVSGDRLFVIADGKTVLAV